MIAIENRWAVYLTHVLLPQASATEKKVVVVSVSPQSRASLAAFYGLSSSEAGRRLTSFFKGLGEVYVTARKAFSSSKHWTLFPLKLEVDSLKALTKMLLLQASITCLTQASVGPSACWRARESLWSVSKGRSKTAEHCP